jgi:acetylglutamate kinase
MTEMTNKQSDISVGRSFSPSQSVGILLEALPYIQKWKNKVVVVKYGGNAFFSRDADLLLSGKDENNSDPLASFANDIVLLRSVGMHPVVVHGGGPQIGEMMKRLGKEPSFVNGQRVTDRETLEIASMVLVGKINKDIVRAINVLAPVGIGLSGEDAGLIKAEAMEESLGYVGSITDVDPSILLGLIHQGMIPVVATIGSDILGQAYNINADTVASAIAQSLQAEKLIYLTNVSGILGDTDDPESLISVLTAKKAFEMVELGAISSGMIPKVDACMKAVQNGVSSCHILDGRIEHSVLIELFTDLGLGTMVTA